MLDLGPWDAAAVVVKFLAYAGTLTAGGGVWFLTSNRDLLDRTSRGEMRRVLRYAVGVAVVATATRLPVIAASMRGDAGGLVDGALLRLLWRSGAGWAEAALLLGLSLLLPCLKAEPASLARARTHAALMPLLGSALAVTSFAWVGHAHGAAHPVLATLLLSIHLLAVAFWLGALLPLRLLCRADHSAVLASAAARFGRAARGVVAALGTAGAALLALLLYGVPGPLAGTYGRYFAVKLALVGVLLSLAAVNRWRLTPRLSNDVRARARLLVSIDGEIGLAACILLVTATLTTLSGPEA